MGFSRVSMFIAGALAFCAASVLSGQETIVSRRIGYPPAQAAAVPAEGTAEGVFHMALPPPLFGGEAARFSLIAGQAGFGLAAVAGAPYSAQAVTETSRVLGDGTRIQQKNTVAMYRDSEGRTRHEQTLDGIGPWRSATGTVTVVFIHDPVAKEMYTLNPADKTATKSVIEEMFDPAAGTSRRRPEPPPGEVRAAEVRVMRRVGGPDGGAVLANRLIHAGRAENSQTESLGQQNIEGVMAEGTRVTTTIEVGKIGNDRPITIVSEHWYSPDLKMTVMSKRTDPLAGDTSYKVTNLVRAEQPRSLFEIPPDYSVKENRGFFRHTMEVKEK